MSLTKIAWVIFIGTLALGGSARAADDVVRATARQHYDRGLEQALQGHYEAALREFLAAYHDQPHYAALYNIGQAYIELGRPVEAIAALERYLEDGRGQLSLERVERVRLQIAAQTARTAELIVTLEAPGARVALDGVPAGSGPRVGPLRVMPGAHELTLSNAGAPDVRRSVLLVAGQTLELVFPGVPLRSAPEPVTGSADASGTTAAGLPASPPVDAAEAGADGTVAALGYVLGGVGLALTGVAVGHYFYNRERYDRWQTENRALLGDDSAGQAHRERQLDNNALAASIERASHWTVALGVAGGAFLASGATLLVVSARLPGSEARESAALFLLQGVW